MSVIKTAVRTLVAFFAGFFGTVQLSMTTCPFAPKAAWVLWLCRVHPLVSSALSFVFLFALTLVVLSHTRATWRVPLAVMLLLSYGVYGIVDAIGYRAWWLALVPVCALAAAVGVGLRARWGTLLTYAICSLFALYWAWGVITAARSGAFLSQPSLVRALMLVPGIAFGLLAGFCCYASSGGDSTTTAGGSARSSA
jgi:hypothetical protein